MIDTRYLRNIDALIAGVAGFYIIHLFARYSGIGISPDSIMYASTAQNIHDHFSLITFNGKPLTFFPVFYPTFLAVCIFLSGGATPVAAGPVINGVLFAATIFTTGYIITRFKNNSLTYKWLILLAMVLSPALLNIYMYLWSETLFIFEILLFAIAFYNYSLNCTLKSLVTVAAVAAIACITRYAGITLVLTGGALVLLDARLPLNKKIKNFLTFGAISISLLLANLILNRVSTGLSTGKRLPAVTSFAENLHYFGTTMLEWAGLPATLNTVATALGAVAIIGLTALFIIYLMQKRVNGYEQILICFTLVYGLFILIIASISRFEQLNSRLLSPMFVPLLLSATCWVPDMLKSVSRSKKWMLATPIVLAMLVYEYAIAKIDYQLYDDYREYGIPGYTDDDWNRSDFVVFLKTHKTFFTPGYPIYTDADEAVYIFSGLHSTEFPHKAFASDVNKLYNQKHFYVIDFKQVDSPELMNLQDISSRKKLVRLFDFKQGAVYLHEEAR